MRPKGLLISIALALLSSAPGRLFADEPVFSRTVPLPPGTALRLDCRLATVRLAGGQGQEVVVSSLGYPEPVVDVAETLVNVTLPEAGLKHQGPEIKITLPRQTSTTIDLDVGNLEIVGLDGRLEAKIGVGDVTLAGALGQISIKTNTGNIRASWTQELPDQCRLSTGVGNIRVFLPSEAELRITAETGLGSIRGLGQLEAVRSRIQTTGDGSRYLSLSTGIGDIRIRRDGTAEETTPKEDLWRQRRHLPARGNYGGGGGFFVAWPDRSFRDFNAATAAHGYPAVEKESYAWGGEGYAQFNRFRIGGMGWGSKIEARSSLSDTLRYATYHYGYGGVTLEYVVLRSSRADLSLGAMLGGGGSEIRLAKAIKSDITWDEAARLEDYREVSVNAAGLAAMPLARFKLRLLGWLSIQGQAGYLYCRPSDWKYLDEKDLFNVPRLDASGWVFALGPHFGF